MDWHLDARERGWSCAGDSSYSTTNPERGRASRSSTAAPSQAPAWPACAPQRFARHFFLRWRSQWSFTQMKPGFVGTLVVGTLVVGKLFICTLVDDFPC